MRNFLFFLLMLSFPLVSHANGNFGRKIVPPNNGNGKPLINGTYATLTDQTFNLSISIMGNQLVGSKPGVIAPAFWALMDKTSGAFISDWQENDIYTGYVLPGAALPFQLDVPETARDQAWRMLPGSVLVFSFGHKTPTPTVYVDIGEFCTTHPEQFLDLDELKTGCYNQRRN